MRILLHDFGGYPFPIELSRELANRGHDVMHAYCGSIKTTPGGDHKGTPEDPKSLTVRPVLLREPLNKYSFFKRWRQENEYGRLIANVVTEFQPDVVVSANTPLDAQARLQKLCRSNSIPFVFWLQDILSIATDRLLRKKLSLPGALIGKHYLKMESRLLRQSDRVVLITEDFRPLMHQWNVNDDRMSVIENWAPLHQLPVVPKENDWSIENDLSDKSCVVYTGTLGMKHNPNLLLQLAIALKDRRDARVVVVSEGLGAKWLKEQCDEHGLKNLMIYGFGPFEQVPKVMGTADVLVAVLESDAGVFSVPSKVLAYLCAGKALSLAMPLENLASRIVQRHQAGRVVEPDDLAGFVQQTIQLLDEPNRRDDLGRSARLYAEKVFDIEKITDAFSADLEHAISSCKSS